MTDKNTALLPEEGWHCLHLFYRIEYGQWQLLNRAEQNAAKTNLTSLVQEIRAMDSTQLLTLSIVTPKADLGFMLLTPDLHTANKIEKRLTLALGPDVLTPVYSYLSLTEESEYIRYGRRIYSGARSGYPKRSSETGAGPGYLSRPNQTLSAGSGLSDTA